MIIKMGATGTTVNGKTIPVSTTKRGKRQDQKNLSAMVKSKLLKKEK